LGKLHVHNPGHPVPRQPPGARAKRSGSERQPEGRGGASGPSRPGLKRRTDNPHRVASGGRSLARRVQPGRTAVGPQLRPRLRPLPSRAAPRSTCRTSVPTGQRAEAGGFEPPVPCGTLAFKFCLRSFASVPGHADVRVQRRLQPAGGCRTPPN